MGFGVEGLGLRLQGFGFRGMRVWGVALGLGVSGSGSRASGFRLGVGLCALS